MSQRIITIQASGRRVGQDVQMPFDPEDPSTYFTRRPANFGDFVVTDSMLRLLDATVGRNIQFPNTPLEGPLEIDFDGVDALILRGANYLRPNLDLTGLGQIIEQAGKPCVVMGIGGQASDFGTMELSDGTKRALAILSDHCATIGTRGEYTAELLDSIGITNAKPVGCPSLFRRNDPTLQIEAGDTRRVSYNMNRHMVGIYGRNRLVANRLQREIFKSIDSEFELSTFCQGEPAEFIAAFALEARYSQLTTDLLSSGFIDSPKDPLLGRFRETCICPTSVSDWETKIQMSDAVIGMRFHGNTVALSNGIPSVYLINDTRVHELALHFAIPFFDMRDTMNPPNPRLLLDQADYSVFNRLYSSRYHLFRTYLEENGLHHVMMDAGEEKERLSAAEVAADNVEILNGGSGGAEEAEWLREQFLWASSRLDHIERRYRGLQRKLQELANS